MVAEPYAVLAGERVGLVRRVRWVAPAAAGLAMAVGVAWANGSYFPTTWGWTALVLLAVAAGALAFRVRIAVSGRERLFLAALAAFIGWTALSAVWSQSVPGTVREVERSLAYVAAALALVVLVDRSSVGRLLGGALTGITGVCAYALATRLFPEQLGSFDPVAGYRLAEPLGYWNGLGLYCAMGALLALGLAARHTRRQGRVLAAATLPLLATTLFFTFSRGAWFALAVGFVAMIVLERARLRLVAAAAALAPASAIAILLAAHEDALTHRSASLALASREGHRLAPAIALLAIGSAICALGLAALQRRVRIGPRACRAIGITLLAGTICAAGALVAAKGGPGTVAHSLASGFTARQAADRQSDLNNRILTVSSNGRIELWGTAFQDVQAHPILGSGAGTYEQFFYAHRDEGSWSVRDAHNLYLETLAELGPGGLALLVLALGLPLLAARHARGDGLAIAAAGVYVAYLVHAGWDWDWELPAATLVALVAAAALLARARPVASKLLAPRMRIAIAAALVLPAAFATTAGIGNHAAAAAQQAAAAGDWSRATSQARRAIRLAPWASDPWQSLAQARMADGDFAGAAAALHTALRKDPHNWVLWLDLAIATEGAQHRQALDRARALNPLNPDLPTT